MPIFVVITVKYSDTFDQELQDRIAQLKSGVTLEHAESDGSLKTYYMRLAEDFSEVDGDFFLGEFFKFDQDILVMTFLRREKIDHE
jgi:hypothetical protein